MGIPYKGCRKIIRIINVYFRRINCIPVHLAHASTQNIFQRLGQPSPWPILQNHINVPPNVIVLIPENPVNHLEIPSDASQPHAQAHDSATCISGMQSPIQLG